MKGNLRIVLVALIATGFIMACNLLDEVVRGSGNWYVSTMGNDSNDCLSEMTACRTIQAAINRASEGSNIHIGAGTYTERIRVNKDGLRIFGADEDTTIIDGGGAGTVLTIGFDGASTGDGVLNVLMSQLTIQNGSADRGGGILIRPDAYAVLVLMRIQNNTARVGAGLANDGNADIYDLSIVSNYATEHCGGVHNVGIYQMFSGEVSDNSTDGYGGGICNEAGATMTMRRPRILRNTAAIVSNVGAGGVYNAGTVGLYNGLVDGNRARGNGGGIFNVSQMTIGRTTISHNFTAQEGGGIFTCAGEMEASTVTGNSGNTAVFAEYGGSFDTGPGVCLRPTDVFLLENSTISGNDFIGLGVNGNFRLESSTIVYNQYGFGVLGLSFLIDSPEADWYIQNMLIAYNLGGDCFDPPPLLPDGGHNLDSDGSCPFNRSDDLSNQHPMLGALADNGGGTWTHELLPPLNSNPAIDHGGTDCPDQDQRAVMRPQEGDGDGTPECDIGAFEVEEFGRLSIPLVESTPTPIASPEPATVTFIKNAFCRKGPGVNYDDIASGLNGQTATVEGRNQDNSWWYILNPDGKTRCWVSNTTVETHGPANESPILPAPPLPDPVNEFVIGKRMCSPNGFKILLSWSKPTADFMGYRLYRNSELIATFKSNQTTYQDSPPMQQSLFYELAVYNSNGSSEHMRVDDPGCP